MQSFYKGPRLFVTALTPRKSPQPRERNSCLFQGTPCLGRNTQKTAKGHGRGSRHRTSGGIRDGEMQQVDLNYSGSNQVRHKHWLLPPSHAPLKWQQRDFFFFNGVVVDEMCSKIPSSSIKSPFPLPHWLGASPWNVSALTLCQLLSQIFRRRGITVLGFSGWRHSLMKLGRITERWQTMQQRERSSQPPSHCRVSPVTWMSQLPCISQAHVAQEGPQRMLHGALSKLQNHQKINNSSHFKPWFGVVC